MKGVHVLVVGTGKSGIGAAKLLARQGAYPVLFDENEKADIQKVKESFKEYPAVRILTGTLPEELTNTVSLAILSPGVPLYSPLASSLLKRKIVIRGEIELAYLYEKGTVTAITGTNGKTTTTTLTGQILKNYFGHTFVAGNIGEPYTLAVSDTDERSMTVVEVSSFQLETIERFHPRVSAILNITPDHLDRHGTMEEYIKAKERIAENQTKEDVCVLNYDNSYTREFAARCPARVVFFSSRERLADGYFLKGEDICQAERGTVRKLLTIHDMKLVGTCNYENVMAAIAITAALGVPTERIVQTVREFQPVEHRIEYVATRNGVDYYNDSKATNPDAAIQGIRAMVKPTVLIAGGYDKHAAYDAWIEAFEGKVKCLILIGQTREKIAACAQAHGVAHIRKADSLEEAVALCADMARPGDAALLSPACASWGMFPDYEVRGRMFKKLVERLP